MHGREPCGVRAKLKSLEPTPTRRRQLLPGREGAKAPSKLRVGKPQTSVRIGSRPSWHGTAGFLDFGEKFDQNFSPYFDAFLKKVILS